MWKSCSFRFGVSRDSHDKNSVVYFAQYRPTNLANFLDSSRNHQKGKAVTLASGYYIVMFGVFSYSSLESRHGEEVTDGCREEQETPAVRDDPD